MRKNEKGIVPVLILVVIAVILGAVFIMRMQNTGNKAMLETSDTTVPEEYRQLYRTAVDNAPAVENSDDLDKASAELDSTSTAEMDAELNSLESLANF